MIDEIGNRICMAEQTAGRNGVADIADRETNDFGRETSHRTQRQSAAATSLRDSHPARASHLSHLRRHYQPPFPLRCKRQTGQHILMTELGEVFQKFRLTGASGQALQDVPHGQSCSPHTGLAEPNSRIDGDPLKVVHLLTLGPTSVLFLVPGRENQIIFKQLLRIDRAIAVGQHTLVVVFRLRVQTMSHEFTADPTLRMVL